MVEAEFLCLADGGQHFLSVAHVSGDSVDFVPPGQVTEGHVMVDVSGFSCFGLVTAAADEGAISGLVLLFREPSSHSLFVLLLPRNVCLPQVCRPHPRTQDPITWIDTHFHFELWIIFSKTSSIKLKVLNFTSKESFSILII